MSVSETTHRPWEHKTIDKFTTAELVHWVNWYTTGRKGPVTFDAETVVHNILLWERTRLEIRAEIFEALLKKVPEGTQMDEFDQAAVKTAMEDLLAKGWDKYEVVRYLRWTEHVNSLIDEDTALANMKRIREEVETRLQKM